MAVTGHWTLAQSRDVELALDAIRRELIETRQRDPETYPGAELLADRLERAYNLIADLAPDPYVGCWSRGTLGGTSHRVERILESEPSNGNPARALLSCRRVIGFDSRLLLKPDVEKKYLGKVCASCWRAKLEEPIGA